MEEKWKDIEGYEGSYQISNLGRVKSLERYNSKGDKLKEKILKNRVNSQGYLSVVLYRDNTKKQYKVHKLVAKHFIPNPNNLPYINHINQQKNNNRVENLEWCTPQYNSNYSLGKPILQFTKSGEIVRKWGSAMNIQRELGFNQGCITNCCRLKPLNKTAYGFIWRYYYKGIWQKKHIPLRDKRVA